MNATKSVPRGGKSLSTTLMWTQCLVLVGASVHPCLGVQWNVVRESIGQKICLSDSGMPIIGTPTSCKSRGDTAPKEVEEASLAAFEEAHPLFVTLPGVFSLLPDALNAAAKSPDVDRREEQFRSALLGDERFLRVLVPRIEEILAAKDVQCEGCPRFLPLKERAVSWDTVGPYVEAFIWVDPVKTVADDGTLIEKPRYHFHICSTLNGLEDLPEDPSLARFGFIAARAVKMIALEILGEVRTDPAYFALQSDEARTSFLRRQMQARLHLDKRIKTYTCQVMDTYGPDLGLKLSDCTGSPVPAMPAAAP